MPEAAEPFACSFFKTSSTFYMPPAEVSKDGVCCDPRRPRPQPYAVAQVFANSSIDVPSILGLVF